MSVVAYRWGIDAEGNVVTEPIPGEEVHSLYMRLLFKKKTTVPDLSELVFMIGRRNFILWIQQRIAEKRLALQRSFLGYPDAECCRLSVWIDRVQEIPWYYEIDHKTDAFFEMVHFSKEVKEKRDSREQFIFWFLICGMLIMLYPFICLFCRLDKEKLQQIPSVSQSGSDLEQSSPPMQQSTDILKGSFWKSTLPRLGSWIRNISSRLIISDDHQNAPDAEKQSPRISSHESRHLDSIVQSSESEPPAASVDDETWSTTEYLDVLPDWLVLLWTVLPALILCGFLLPSADPLEMLNAYIDYSVGALTKRGPNRETIMSSPQQHQLHTNAVHQRWVQESNDSAQSRQRASPQPQPQRRRGNRRANRERQAQQIAGSSLEMADQTPPSENRTDSTGGRASNLTLSLGGDLCFNRVAINAQKPQDECPICLHCFDEDLADTYCAVLNCKHAYCVPCLKKIEAHAGVVNFPCPTCRVAQKTDLSQLHYLLYPVVVGDRMNILKEVSTEDKIDMFKSLLHANSYQKGKVDEALEDMLVGSVVPLLPPSAMENGKDFSPEEKQAIYMETRRPIQKIRHELAQARKRLQKAQNADMYTQTKQEVEDLKKRLIEATKNAREDAYNQINSRGNMGIIDDRNLKIDFHTLHRDDSVQKLKELVVPMLPALGEINIITGWGKHSSTGVGVLQQALKDHIDKKHSDSMRWEPYSMTATKESSEWFTPKP
ncbi:expressed unknown protein [Seminavis robusta]|uniref:RING-type domain-containing protein n=1 Tax=Seminavis robusta TaxID=568900 RepID=A0A9N8F2U2_9STRA|nr:expressed unknown protein [Seminavis robusta]|eukprot:Sro2572_g331610.1 n/a (717) ;mRNA; f:2013-4163